MTTANNQDAYNKLNAGERLIEPSYMGIIPQEIEFKLSKEYLKQVLDKNKEFELKSIQLDADSVEKYPSYRILIKYRNKDYKVQVAQVALDKDLLKSLTLANPIKKMEQAEAMTKDYYIDVSMLFAGTPLESYLFQLKLMHTIVPRASLGIDFSAYTVFAVDWLKMLVKADIPPAPRYLYSIHAVYDQKDGKQIHWFHTHGLLRCGSIELEAINIKYGAEQVHSLISHAADMFVEQSYRENEKIPIAFNGLVLFLTWLRWEEVLKDYPKDMLGGIEERMGEVNVHNGPSGILFAVEQNNELVSPEIYVNTLQENPVFWISKEESARMRSLAHSQWHIFTKTFSKLNPKEEPSSFIQKIFKSKSGRNSQWSFKVKLGLLIDDADNEDDKEHLWFDVIAIDRNQISAKLLDQPYWIAELDQGDIVTYPIDDLLTDWIINSSDAIYTPDSAYQLM